MRFNTVNRRVHYWISAAAALPLLVMLVTGVLLQTKKHWSWVQPHEVRGTGTEPVVGLDGILESVRGVSHHGVAGWDDVNRIDVRPERGVAKVWLRNGWELQIDLGTGAVLADAYRRSDLIESLHDGSFFLGDWTKLGLFLPAGLVLVLLWLTGLRMFYVTWAAKRRRAAAARGTGAPQPG